MAQNMNELEAKRQLSFLNTFGRKFEGFRREMERLRRARDTGTSFDGKWPTDGLERTAKSLIGAGAVYGLTQIAEWAKLFLKRLDVIGSRDTPPTADDMDWLAHQISALEQLKDEATLRAGGKVKPIKVDEAPVAADVETGTKSASSVTPIAEKSSSGDLPLQKSEPDIRRASIVPSISQSPLPSANPIALTAANEDTLCILVCVKDANIGKKISFILKGAGYGPKVVTTPAKILQRIYEDAPELLIIDFDDKAPFGAAVTQQLSLDSLADYMPVLKIGTSVLGQSFDIVRKPVQGKELLERVKKMISTNTHAARVQIGLRDPNLEELLAFIAGELKVGILDSVTGEHARERFRLGGEGKILAGVWSLIARIRQSAAKGSKGKIRFAPATSGKMTMMALSEGDGVLQELGELDRRDLAELKGMRAVVADGDAEIRVLFDRVLTEAGLKVRTAVDGIEALDSITSGAPDFVISDIAMPDMDGWELGSRLKTDYRLRSIPVIMLSWKEAFLQRVRSERRGSEIKLTDADKQQILSAIVRAIRPRLVLARKLSKPEDVTGRVEQMGVTTVLGEVARKRENCQIYFRESWSDYDVSIRHGRLVSVTMTGTDGSFAKGPRALERLLGIDAAKFEVRKPDGNPREQFDGSIAVVLNEACKRLNTLVAQVKDGAMFGIHSVTLDEDALDRYKSIIPAKLTVALEQLAAGKSPETIVQGDVVSPDSLETLLLELVRNGAVVAFDAPAPDMKRVPIARDTTEWQSLGAGEIVSALRQKNTGTSSDTMPVEIGDLIEVPSYTVPPPLPKSVVVPEQELETDIDKLTAVEQEKKTFKRLGIPIFAALGLVVVAMLFFLNLGNFNGWVTDTSNKSSNPVPISDSVDKSARRGHLNSPSEVKQEELRASASMAGTKVPQTENSGSDNADRENERSEETSKHGQSNTAKPLPKTVKATKGTSRSSNEDKQVAKEQQKKKAKERGPTGKLRVRAPDGATSRIRILVDGRRRGNAPKTIRLSPGLHEVTFIMDGKEALRMVSIKADDVKDVTPKF